MPAAAIAVPAAMSLVGSVMQKKSADKATAAAANAAQFHPYDVNGLFGGVDFSGNSVSVNPNQATTNQYNSLGDIGQQLFGGNGPTSGFQNFSNAFGNNQLPGIFGNALSQSGVMPSQDYMGNQAALANLGSQNQGLMASLLGAGQGAYGNAQNLFGQAQGIAGQDVSGLVNSNLALLRQQAAPQEQQQLNTFQNQLFSQGRMGSTGGALQSEAFARGLGQADLGRQMAAQQLGLQAQQQNTAVGNLFGQMGSSQSNAAQGYGGLLGNMIGQGGNLANSQYSNALGYNDLSNSRAQQMMQNAMGLFGFGNQLGQQDLQSGLAALGGQQSIDTGLRNLIALGGNIGGTQAQAGGNMAQAYLSNQGSPMGSFLGAFGNGLLSQAPSLMNQMQYNRLQPVNTGGASYLPGGTGTTLSGSLQPMPNFGGP